MKKRVCDKCGSVLFGPKRHGWVVANGKSIICGDYKKHDRLRRGRKWNYGDENETKEEEDLEVLT